MSLSLFRTIHFSFNFFFFVKGGSPAAMSSGSTLQLQQKSRLGRQFHPDSGCSLRPTIRMRIG